MPATPAFLQPQTWSSSMFGPLMKSVQSALSTVQWIVEIINLILKPAISDSIVHWGAAETSCECNVDILYYTPGSRKYPAHGWKYRTLPRSCHLIYSYYQNIKYDFWTLKNLLLIHVNQCKTDVQATIIVLHQDKCIILMYSSFIMIKILWFRQNNKQLSQYNSAWCLRDNETV